MTVRIHETCGQPFLPSINQHIRECPEMDVDEVARRILDGGDFVDAEAELVAAAFLTLKEAAE